MSQVNDLFEELITNHKSETGKAAETFETVEPESVVSKMTMEKEERERLYDMGMETIREGKAAVIIMAGGQGTRLGFSHPKGMYNIGLPSNKSIFQILVERFYKIQMLAHGGARACERLQGGAYEIPAET